MHRKMQNVFRLGRAFVLRVIFSRFKIFALIGTLVSEQKKLLQFVYAKKSR